ncbi:uncharacterized protein KQ657_001941 [Scheffersomyces spartinae]|uniref:NEDD8-activating enzyme E1 regulatory subunit n=1 Tax=Scheffersomyces spartinae TaxID=45513 RepID=A0A9P8AH15_9ASCO|nr:uncharacterized protein KQ657_001941 [Scheffersomyces spartinae]KAG7192223.1 hypothetical protein KQ657_001941 [Scheffersomyces spartinae]
MIDKQTKYDRQLRLWANTGQDNLERCHLCMINADATASETLKNLVLPGLGKFTIVDAGTVCPGDLSGNFFLTEADLGKNRAEALTRNLLELNPDVEGKWVAEQSIDSLDAQFWDQFDMVIISNYVKGYDELVQLLWRQDIPLLVATTMGYYGSLHVIRSETTVVETHHPSQRFQLFLDKPWPELQQFVDSFDLETLDETDHAQVPYIVIYIKLLAQLRASNSPIPKTYQQKQHFKTLIESLSRDISQETNFIEASSSLFRTVLETEIPPSVVEIMKIASKLDLTQTSLFWIYVKALENFASKNEGLLPLPGTLPDMASNTANYVQLQKIYHQKAIKDREAFAKEVQILSASLGREEADDLNLDLISSFCKNSNLLYVSKGSYKQVSEQIVKDCLVPGKYNISAVYLSLLNTRYYFNIFGSLPSIKDLESFTQLAFDVIFKPYMSSISDIPESVILTFTDVLSHNTNSYHNLASFIGGITAQEVLKIATAQYIPLDNVFVFDGIVSTSQKWKIE